MVTFIKNTEFFCDFLINATGIETSVFNEPKKKDMQKTFCSKLEIH